MLKAREVLKTHLRDNREMCLEKLCYKEKVKNPHFLRRTNTTFMRYLNVLRKLILLFLNRNRSLISFKLSFRPTYFSP